jgi:hypothetical protein
LSAYLKSLYGRCHGISFIDSTALIVCDNHRIHNHKVFAGLAQRGKVSMGWFYGFKLHLEVPPKKWRSRKDKVHLNRRQTDERAQNDRAAIEKPTQCHHQKKGQQKDQRELTETKEAILACPPQS